MGASNYDRKRGIMSQRFENILYEKKDLIATVTINRPNRFNSFTLPLMKELVMALEDARDDKAVGVVVITGAEKRAFCPGFDTDVVLDTTSSAEGAAQMYAQSHQLYFGVKWIGKPVIARVNGIAAGGGAELVLYCDLSIAADHASFQAGEAAVGMVPLYDTQLLPIVVGDKRARDLLLNDRKLTAQEALEWGIYNQVVPYDELDAEVNKLCQSILNKPPMALRATKSQINVWFDLVSHTMHPGRDYCVFQAASPEPLEGFTAFQEKRAPRHKERRQAIAEGKATSTFLWGPNLKKCPKCGVKNLPDDFVFCGVCGAKVA
jgi:enoyl-CoA hydratase/carnithine racemase